MADWKTALKQAGLLTERQEAESWAAEQLDREDKQAELLRIGKEKDRRKEILRNSNSPAEFRQEAKKLLVLDPTLLREVINLAHERGMNLKKNGGKRLIWSLYQLRDLLNGKTIDEQKQIVTKEFSKH